MVMQKERISVGTSRNHRENIYYNLANQGCGVIKISYNCPNIKTYFIIKIFLFICLDIGGKISIIRTASRLHDLYKTVRTKAASHLSYSIGIKASKKDFYYIP